MFHPLLAIKTGCVGIIFSWSKHGKNTAFLKKKKKNPHYMYSVKTIKENTDLSSSLFFLKILDGKQRINWIWPYKEYSI